MKQSPKSESWVKEKRRLEGKMVRLTIDVTPEMHQRLKMKCVMERTTIADMIRGWMEEKLKKYGKHTIFLGSSFLAHQHKQHEGARGDAPERTRQLLKGETKRKRLGIPMFLGKMT